MKWFDCRFNEARICEGSYFFQVACVEIKCVFSVSTQFQFYRQGELCTGVGHCYFSIGGEESCGLVLEAPRVDSGSLGGYACEPHATIASLGYCE